MKQLNKIIKITTEQEFLCRSIAEKFVSQIKDKSIIYEVEESLYQSTVVAIAYQQLKKLKIYPH